MINLFENFDQASRDYFISLKIAKMNIPSVVMNDDGFVPDSIDSAVQYYCDLQSTHRPMYFDQVPTPGYWRIVGDANQAGIYDLKTKKANIIYLSNDNQRIVKEVQWLNENGQIAWSDHYDKHATLFAKTFYQNGQALWTNYYNQQGRRVIERNLVAGDIFLDTGKRRRHFRNLAEFTLDYLKFRHYKLDHILYNTLNQSLAVTLLLPADSGEDILLWHEKSGDDLPGNMQLLINNQTRTKHILFQDPAEWADKKEQLPTDGNVDFNYLGMIYIHPRGNSLRPQALTLTNSDQLERLEQLTQLMPNVTFNIAAVTEMSDKLMAFGNQDNVNLYPTVNGTILKHLLDECDLYFDINHQDEILDAVRGAFEQNMLILSFADILHEPKFTNPQMIFESSDAGAQAMAKSALSALVKPNLMGELVDGQRSHAGDVWPKDYHQILGAMIDES